jgi:hypothetical protein
MVSERLKLMTFTGYRPSFSPLCRIYDERFGALLSPHTCSIASGAADNDAVFELYRLIVFE